jgi:dolichyl-diphosphooligosaccharide--protein glycosyltransferase/undecaprenyl-diphosphooligosaccharide--protein glycosyltransferase
MFKKEEWEWKEFGLMILIAYLFSFAVRLIWVWQFKDNPAFYWNNQLMINTNDGYFFASAVDYLLNGIHANNPRVGIAIESYPGMVYFSYLLVKLTPMSLETTILYAPAIVSSLIVVPMILTGKLLRLPWIGFFSALVGSIGWSYYNRTMTGYYDSDMFSVLLQFTVLYLFLLTLHSKRLISILALAIGLLIYPLFYPQGLSLVYAMFILWVIYQFIFYRDEQHSYLVITVASVALWSTIPLIKIVIIVAIMVIFNKLQKELDQKKLLYMALGSLFLFFIFGNVFQLIFSKVFDYTDRGVKEEGLHFYQVIQTVREAGAIPWDTVANRVLGGWIPLVLSVIGYFLLVIRKKEFLIALPLIGVGVFAHWAGLRFTVYAVPVAAISAVYLFSFIADRFIVNQKAKILLIALLSMGLLYPNIVHIIGYKVPTVFNKTEVEDLVKLDKIASDKDYTLTWWDYGYPIWFYSDTSTLIDGAKHHNDNFIISKIMFSTSPQQVANLSRLAVETYAMDESHPVVADKIFKDKNPNQLLEDLKKPDFKLPPKTRDVYLYMPYRMMRIFPTVGVFGNLNLKTGRKERNIAFYPTQIRQQNATQLLLANGIIFDLPQGVLRMGKTPQKVYRFDIVEYRPNGNSIKRSQTQHLDGKFCVVYLKSYNSFVIMDRETYNSAYVQMFMLDNYDRNLFELVVSSPYSKIFKIKK